MATPSQFAPDAPPTVLEPAIHPARSSAGPVSVTPAPPPKRTADRLAAAFDLSPPEWPTLPKVGDRFLGFDLTDELGRGGFGRVFLAEQRDLADRPVALKVMIGGDAESHHLARLQHTNIMPIYSAHREGQLAAVCMPFLGRATLGDLCTSVRSRRQLPASGGHLVSTLFSRRDGTRSPRPADDTRVDSHRHAAARDQAGSPTAPSPEGPTPALTHLSALSYVDAVLWIGGRVAEGLAHAHDRGIIHRDLKPANVLVTDDGQPMILDFNLAVDVRKGEAGRGGTIQYMSPEQLHGMTDAPRPVDHRTDLYSLGLILFELLTGRQPFPAPDPTAGELVAQLLTARSGQRPSVRKHNPSVSPTGEAIIHKCLAPAPADRYESAHELVEDLRLHRADRPVRYADNPSWRELAGKWVRRHPRLSSPVAVTAVVAAFLLTAAAGLTWTRLTEERAELTRTAERGQELVSAFDALRGTAEQYLTSHNGKPELLARGRDAGFQALNTLTAGHAGDWTARPEFRHLPAEERSRLTDRAAELVYLLGRSADGRDAAEGFWGRFPAPPADRNPLLRAAELHAGGKFRESIVDLNAHTRARPDDAGGWFLLGRAHTECGNNDDAYTAYSAGIALRPRYAAGYYFRAEIADRLKRPEPVGQRPQALADIDRAVDLDPGFVEARLFRAQLLVRGKRHDLAREDLDRILGGDAPPTRAWLLSATVWAALGDKGKAEADRAEGLKRKPATSTDYVARGVAKRATDPAAALADFRTAETLDPMNTAALEHQAFVQAELLHRPDLAAETLARLLAVTPRAPLAFVSRAVYLARSGETAAAVAEAEKALELGPQPGVQYRVGCVYALAAKADPKYAAPALKHVAAALRSGFGHEYLPADPDLDPLRGRDEFDRLTALVKALNALAAPK
jgi:serine/threonine protein kinase/predicted Zn-dependent protease